MDKTNTEPKEWKQADEQFPEVSPQKSKGRRMFLLSTVLLLVAVFLVWFFLMRDRSVSAPVHPVEEQSEVKEEISAPLTVSTSEPKDMGNPAIVPLTVSLTDSDEPLRNQAAGISSQPRLSTLLKEQDIIRRFVAAANAIALGESPAKMLESLTPSGKFKVLRQNGTIRMDPSNYTRYDETMNLLLSLKPEACAELYLRFEPQIEEAYRELGQQKPDSFREILKNAVDQLQRTPIPPDRIELVEKTVSYAFADPSLEELNAAQKQFIRLGPAHLRQMQGKIRLLLDTLLNYEKTEPGTQP